VPGLAGIRHVRSAGRDRPGREVWCRRRSLRAAHKLSTPSRPGKKTVGWLFNPFAQYVRFRITAGRRAREGGGRRRAVFGRLKCTERRAHIGVRSSAAMAKLQSSTRGASSFGAFRLLDEEARKIAAARSARSRAGSKPRAERASPSAGDRGRRDMGTESTDAGGSSRHDAA